MTPPEQVASGIRRQGRLQLLWKDTPTLSVLSLFHRTAGVSSQRLGIQPSVFILSTARERGYLLYSRNAIQVYYWHLSTTIHHRKQDFANEYPLYAPRLHTSPRYTTIAVIDVSLAAEGVPELVGGRDIYITWLLLDRMACIFTCYRRFDVLLLNSNTTLGSNNFWHSSLTCSSCLGSVNMMSRVLSNGPCRVWDFWAVIDNSCLFQDEMTCVTRRLCFVIIVGVES